MEIRDFVTGKFFGSHSAEFMVSLTKILAAEYAQTDMFSNVYSFLAFTSGLDRSTVIEYICAGTAIMFYGRN